MIAYDEARVNMHVRMSDRDIYMEATEMGKANRLLSGLNLEMTETKKRMEKESRKLNCEG